MHTGDCIYKFCKHLIKPQVVNYWRAAYGKREICCDPVMATPLPKDISPPETARYTSDMLESLRKMAAEQGQNILAHLLELARAEAKLLIRDGSGDGESSSQA